jgi:pyruvate,water dikinase
MNVIASLKNAFSFLYSSKPPLPFTVLFKKFQSVLDRNNRILEIMADMGDKLGGEYVFDRQYILEACERVSDLVFKLISDLCVLNQRKNVDLFIAFEGIRYEIQEELAGRHAFPTTRHTILLDDLGMDSSDEVGNKFASLGDIRNVLGLPTPDGFVITTKAFFDFMQCNNLPQLIEDALSKWDGKDEPHFAEISGNIRERILEGEIPRHFASHISAMIDILAAKRPKADLRFAVRSSAWGEDSEQSFAGQYESLLNVPKNAVLDAYKQVVASAYSPEAWRYRLDREYREHEMAMAVGCQLMLDADASGVLYTYSPLTPGEEHMVVSAAWGLGPAVVKGVAKVDTIVLERSLPHSVHSIDVGHKTRKLESKSSGGAFWTDVPEERRDVPCLNPAQMEKLAQAATIIERYHKRPQDIEWAFDKDGDLFILQSRPLNIRAEGLDKLSQIVDDAALSARVVFAGRGQVVQRGIGTGRVFVALKDEDLNDFPHGSILVAKYTSPKYSRIMRKANGIITDIGSPTGHMATLAREYRLPTIVDTDVATQVLRTGDEITLDATQNVVYRGTIKELSQFELTEGDVFEDSYEYRLLRRLLKKISPLNLVDPHSEDFRASNCRTYHDITRYIHETAVEKLINLSENYQKYHTTTPKRLESDLPLGLIVIDVENGTSVPPETEVVTVKDIRSVPMKALLQGLTESGMWTTNPVPVDLGSFMSSFTRTMSAPMAAPGKHDRNLAVISKEYMNLNLKLGYHFNIVDAYIGDSVNDNYISFRFLGGVTNFIRRSRRAMFIGEVLERFDFLVEVHGDLVVGRIKKSSKERMVDKMKILGGLIGYTRQLDVSMTNNEQITRHLTNFTQLIQTVMEA